MDLFQRAPLLAWSRLLGLQERRKLERVFVDGAGGTPLRVSWLNSFRTQVAPDGVSGNA